MTRLGSSGISLVEVMVSLAIVSAMGLAIGSLMLQGKRELEWATATANFTEMRSQAIVALRDRANCAKKLRSPAASGAAGAAFGVTDCANPPAEGVNAIILATADPASAIAAHGQRRDGVDYGVTLSRLSLLHSLQPLPGSTLPRQACSATLAVTGTRSGTADRGIGGNTLSFRIPLTLEFDSSGQLTGCGVLSAELERTLIRNDQTQRMHTFTECYNQIGMPTRTDEGYFCRIQDPDARTPGAPPPPSGFTAMPALKECPEGWSRYKDWSSVPGGGFDDSPKSAASYTAIGCH